MSSELTITANHVDPALFQLPWSLPLLEWPTEHVVSLPKGISRHLVRFANLANTVIAVKETTEQMAKREYDMLGTLKRLGAPCVERTAVIAGRTDADGNQLPAALVTAHLQFSMPYRSLFTQALRPKTAERVIDALAALLVRLHNIGFYWGDVSLSNTLFRRDAGAFAAYLVDAETGEIHEEGLTRGQREYDLELARTNIAGEIMDLEAAGRLDAELDAVATVDKIIASYHALWNALTEQESFSAAESWRLTERVAKLNELGFDIDEMSIQATKGGEKIIIRPKVVDAGHHQRRLIRLTGLDVEENQARRLLNDLDEFQVRNARKDADESMLAHEWLTQVFEPVVTAIPYDLRAKLQPAELFHQLLEHRWFLSQQKGGSVSMIDALNSYVNTVLLHYRDEATLFQPLTETITIPVLTQGDADSDSEVDWRDLV